MANGNGKDDSGVLGLGNTAERRLFAGASMVRWLVSGMVLVFVTLGGAALSFDRRQTKIEDAVAQHAAAIEAKQSKEAAEGDKQALAAELRSINKSLDELKTSVATIEKRGRR